MKVPAYFEREVAWDGMFKSTNRDGSPRPTLTMPNKDNAERWASKIHCALSPENLTCDGELPRSQRKRKN